MDRGLEIMLVFGLGGGICTLISVLVGIWI
jgi:hypothetical protein